MATPPPAVTQLAAKPSGLHPAAVKPGTAQPPGKPAKTWKGKKRRPPSAVPQTPAAGEKSAAPAPAKPEAAPPAAPAKDPDSAPAAPAAP